MFLAGAAPALGGLVKGIGGLLGGLFGRKKKTRQTTDYVAMRNAAKAAGFNPLTVLRASGGAGFQTTEPPALSAGDFIGQAMQRGAETWYNAENDKLDREEQQIRMDVMRQELENMRKNPYGNFGYNIPQITDAVKNTVAPELEAGRRTSTNAGHVGETNWLSPRVTDAEMAEARYGDVAQEVAGVRNIATDNVYNFRMKRLEAQYGRNVANAVHLNYGKMTDKSLSEIIAIETKGKTPKAAQRPPRAPQPRGRLPDFVTPFYGIDY